MDLVTVAWGVAACAAIGAFVLAIRVATEGRRTGELRAEVEELRKDARSAHKQLEQRSSAVRGGRN